MTTEPPFQIGPGIRFGLVKGLWYGLDAPHSDGEELYWPPTPPYRESSDVNYRIKLGTAWAEKEGIAKVSSKFNICSISYSPTSLASCVKLQTLVEKSSSKRPRTNDLNDPIIRVSRSSCLAHIDLGRNKHARLETNADPKIQMATTISMLSQKAMRRSNWTIPTASISAFLAIRVESTMSP